MLRNYMVTFTSTETLFDEEKQRKQNSVKVYAKDEEAAKQKALNELNATGKHAHIVIHTAQLVGNSRPRISGFIWIFAAVILFLALFSIFRGS